MSDERTALAEAITKESETRENQRATKQALETARERIWQCRERVRAAENALETARASDPDELIAAAREGRAPAMSKTSDQRHALAVARDELEAAERLVQDLTARVPDAEFHLSIAKSSTKDHAHQVLLASPEWQALVEDLRHHEAALITLYATLRRLSDAGVHHGTDARMMAYFNHPGAVQAHQAMLQTADAALPQSWAAAWQALLTQSETPLPGTVATADSAKNPKPKRNLFAAR